MKKTLLFALLIVSILSVQAQTKVAYITFQKTMDATARTVQNDPIIQTLSADPNLAVTVKVLTSVLATDVIADLATYDVIIVQESFGGAAAMLTPAGALALKTIPKPFIYNKMYALQKTRALTNSASLGAGKEADGTTSGTLTITVDAASLTNDLFKACTIVNTNQIKLFNALSTDAGLLGSGTSIKAINYNAGTTLSGGTLLAQPSILASGTTVALAINSLPAGTVIDGTETTQAPAIFVGMNFGAICANNGANITSDALTIWRNAVYILAGLSVPATPASLPTALNNVSASSEVVSEMYYNVNGVQVREPKNNTNGVLIKKVT
ncbi:MAG: hypothetical protein PHR83_19075 [Paludibacter sp.]|nr:hypothetical protein [Paludibacter sp.]